MPIDPLSAIDVYELFVAACDLPPDEREALLARTASSHPQLVAAVRRLLELDEGLSSAEIRGAGGATAGTGHTSLQAATVGPYRIGDELGMGGMGVVYRASRDDGEFDRIVAIKFLRREIASPELVDRFRLERRVLATLDHPGIARLIDAGRTDREDPYLVMEHVDGERLDRWLAEHPSLTERLELFAQICDAVAYAHAQLVVHRDLKPANVLVTPSGAPKLLDFGIAKLLGDATGASDGERSVVTLANARPMTPAYASPEHMRGDPVGTASDIYSLGVILYEMLTGRRPHDLDGRSLREIEEIVCGRSVPPPSAVAAATTSSAPRDATTATAWRRRRRLVGDLDTITLKALHRDPARRYQTAGELALDVRRHLRGEPVSARPDTLLYRTSSFLRRHRLGVATAALIAVAAIVGVAVLWRQREEALRAHGVAARMTESLEQAVSDLLAAEQELRSSGSTAARESLLRGAQSRLAALDVIPPEDRSRTSYAIRAALASLIARLDYEARGSKASSGACDDALRAAEEYAARFPCDDANRQRAIALRLAVLQAYRRDDCTAAGLLAERLLSAASALDPEGSGRPYFTGLAHSHLGTCALSDRRLDAALEHFESARAAYAMAAEREPTNQAIVQALADNLLDFASLLAKADRPIDALPLAAEAEARYAELADRPGDVIAARRRHAQAQSAHAEALRRAGQFERSHAKIDQAIAAIDRLRELDRSGALDESLRMALSVAASVASAQGDADYADMVARRRRQLDE